MNEPRKPHPILLYLAALVAVAGTVAAFAADGWWKLPALLLVGAALIVGRWWTSRAWAWLDWRVAQDRKERQP